MPTTSSSYVEIGAKVRTTLQRAFGPNAAVRTDEGEGGFVYVRIVSERFNGLSERVRQDKIWNVLRQDLNEEADSVALVPAFGTNQL